MRLKYFKNFKWFSFNVKEVGSYMNLLGWLLSPDAFRSYSASAARQVIWLINLLDEFIGIFNLSDWVTDGKK